MTLTPIIKSDDPYFNHEAGQKAADLVMKMDDDTAEMFTYFVMADILDADIEANKRTLQRHINDVVRKRFEQVKKAMATTISKRDGSELEEYAQALELIEKRITDPEAVFWEEVRKTRHQNPYVTGAYQFDESDFRRDHRTGRFQQKINVVADRSTMLNPKQAQNLGIDTDDPKYRTLSNQQKAQFQQEYMKVANFLNIASNMGDHTIRARIMDGNGNMFWRQLNGTPKPGVDWNPHMNETVYSVEAIPTGDLTLGGASFGLVNSLSGGHGLNRNVTGTINRADAKFDGFANSWTDPGRDPYNSNQRLYSRVQSGSEFVANIAPRGTKAQMAARLGQAVGQHGPQAEKVIGPSARKTAYRYRGVEKAPDRQVVREYNNAIGRGEKQQLTDDQAKILRARQNRAVTALRNRKATETNKPVETIRLSATEIAAERNRVGTAYLKTIAAKPDPTVQRNAVLSILRAHLIDSENRKHIPRRDLYELQLESGGTPPSEGFLLDKDGRVVTQAVGYGDDHYLPFNLKHLKQLRGGEYIRSRSVGGPTSEDIYTGLMAGAKRVTVVSRSGTFVIDFEEDFKGKRRYNDKAHRMVRRYEKLLDTVQSEEVNRNVSVSPDVRARIANEVQVELAGLLPADRRATVKSRIAEYKNELSADREDFRIYAADQASGLDERETRVFMAQMMNDWDKHQEFKFRLNGQGYRDALLSLQEQFPYYFKVDYLPTIDPERVETELDGGYVEPGRNRPTKANAGWRGTGTNEGTGHISASQTNYQRGRYGSASDTPHLRSVGRAVAPAAAAPAAPAAAAPTTTGAPTAAAPTPGQVSLAPALVTQIHEEAQDKFGTAAVSLIKALQAHTNIKESAILRLPVLGMTNETEILNYFKDPNKVREADEFFQATDIGGPEDAEELRTAYQEYRKASGQLGRVEFDPKLALTRSGAPFLFPGQAYLPGADPTLAEDEAERIDAATQPVSNSGLKLSEMTDEDLNNEIDVLDKLNRALNEVRGLEPAEKLQRLKDLGIDTSIRGVAQILEGERLGQHAKDVQKMRALNLNRGNRADALPMRVEHLPNRTQEETLKTKESAANHAQELEKAAVILEGSGDQRRVRAGGALRAAAAEWKRKSRQAEIDESDFNAAYDSMQAQMDLMMKVRSGQVEESDIEDFLREYDDEGNGNVLREIHRRDDEEGEGPTLRREPPKRY